MTGSAAPEMRIECSHTKVMSIEALKKIKHPRNPNTHPKEQIRLLAKIMAYQGIRNPIVVSGLTGLIVKGHGRLDAAELNGWTEFPVDVQSYKSKAQEYADLVADNKIQELSKINLNLLNNDIRKLVAKLPTFDLELFGDSKFKIADFDFGRNPSSGLTDEDEVPEAVETRTKVGDIWQLRNHRVMCGDSTKIEDVEKLMGGEKADMVFTDPPYGVSYQSKVESIGKQSKSRNYSKIENDEMTVDDLKQVIQSAFNNIDKVLADKSCYYVASPQGGELGLMMMMMQEANIQCRHMIIWVKNAPVFSMGRLDYDYQHEPILFGWSKNRTHPKSSFKGQWRSSVWTHDKEPNKLHPTMKPTALIENALLNSTESGATCFDPFGGSGSTLIACEKTGRRAFLMEIDPHYVSVILARWEAFTGHKAIKIGVKKRS